MAPQHFHQGELKLQDQVGMRERIGVMTKHLMHDFMPDQHREFFEGLEYIFLGTVDGQGRPNAVIVTGPVGFAATPDAKTLVMQTGDRSVRPEFAALKIGAPVGVLGLDLSNRRRNRMHGRVSAMDDASISISVIQSYGNCPKYINLRDVSERNLPASGAKTTEDVELSQADMGTIRAADTMFIASYVRDNSGAAYEGADMSHRGGQAGFVAVNNPTQITIPDYKGNDLYNTIGNLLLNPETGLLFVDFETGDQLHLHGKAALIEDAASVAQYPGALRLLQVNISNVRRVPAATGLRWRFVETSPVSPNPSSDKD